jgi:single-strand DNA-binding protein
MSNLKNSVQLIGHLGADPERKTLDSGMALCTIRIATTEHFKNSKGEWQNETQWHSVILWDTLAQRAEQYLHKGSYVLLQGKLINRSYTDAQGTKKYITEVRGTNFLILDKKTTEADTIPNQVTVADSSDDLPF